MNKTLIILIAVFSLLGCRDKNSTIKRVAVAKVGTNILYYDEMPKLVQHGINETDSAALIQNYINKWAKRQLLLQKAEDNLSPELKNEITRQVNETRTNLVIYQYQKQMMLEKMDTVLSDSEIENYYAANEKSFVLNSNIVKAVLIKLPVETPNLNKIKLLARSNNHNDMLQLESYCFQFAEKFDDFDEKWVPLDRITVELQQDINDQENFLKKNTFFETSDSQSVYLISIREYRLRSSIAPLEYVRDEIKSIIWNNRRFEFIQSLENGIYNEALKENSFKIY
ncbi:MAG: hypothetical protein LLG13_04745 [Bacteroidales bacterium]|nr:hypothetical protein [Bacteroidales bacterium]